MGFIFVIHFFNFINDHLGNVRATVARADDGISLDVRSFASYYPFGMQMPGMFGGGNYRYAYQGQEKDDETGFEAFELRQWDGRIGRWMTTDPYNQYFSTYLGMGNNPVRLIDPDGGGTDDYIYLNEKGTVTEVVENEFPNSFFDHNGNELLFHDWDLNYCGVGDIANSQFYVGDILFITVSNIEFMQQIYSVGLANNLFEVTYNSYVGWDYALGFLKNKYISEFGISPVMTEINGFLRRRNVVSDLNDVFIKFENSNVLYNFHDAGNFMWGKSMMMSGYGLNTAQNGAHWNEILTGY